MKPEKTRSLEFMTEEERAFHACRDRETLSVTDEAGRSLLHIAAQGGKAAICRIYLNAGIDPSKVDNVGRTAADLAKLAGYASLSRLLENAAAQQTKPTAQGATKGYDQPLDVREQRALIAGDLDVLVGLIAAKRLDARNAKGDSPIHLAAAGGHLLLCSQLFEAGADTSSRNNSGQTPADMASEAGHRQLAAMLRGLNHERLKPGAQAAPPVARVEGDYADASNQEMDALAELDFDSEEEPVAFHARQDIDTVSATFVAIPSGSGLRTGDIAENEDWEVPSSLAKVRANDHVADSSTDEFAGAAAGIPDFSSLDGRSSRRPRKLISTRFQIDEAACRRWVRDRLATGEADDQAIGDLLGECRGNQSPDELAVNVLKALADAGIRTEESTEPCLQLHSPSTIFVDEDDLVEAIAAACTRNTVVPGRQLFSVDRATEQRLVREISKARHELLNAILDDPVLLAAIVMRGEKVLEREIAVDAFTDLEIEVADDEDFDGGFSINLETLREVRDAGVAIGGRARRRAMESLDGLELTRSCLNDLALEVGGKTASAIGHLLAACDRSAESFLLAHLPFARRETAKMALPDEDPEELFQEAYFALRRAVERFDPDRGVRFYLYALFWIRQQIGRWRLNTMSLIRVPVHRYELNSKITAFKEEFLDQYYREPTDLEISNHLECDVKAIKSLALALSKPLVFDQIMSDRADVEDSPEELARRRQSNKLIRHELNELDERQNDILQMRFGIDRDDEMTLEEIGQIYGVTRERIRQIEAKALAKLGHPGRVRFLRELL